MRTAAAVCYVLACLAELGGVALIVREAVTAKRVLTKWEAADNPANDGAGTWDQAALVNKVASTLLAARAGAAWAVVLLVVGIITGTIGNFLTL